MTYHSKQLDLLSDISHTVFTTNGEGEHSAANAR
nr:MAG TPA: hypothetical protein [Caudoviricetes sp.]